MTYREKLQLWVWDALNELGGSGSIVDVARIIWRDHEDDLKSQGDRFYNWQYDMRWAAQELRSKQRISFEKRSGKSFWFVR